jgi:hypothetical protein
MCSIRESWAGALIIACRKQQLLPLQLGARFRINQAAGGHCQEALASPFERCECCRSDRLQLLWSCHDVNREEQACALLTDSVDRRA